MKFLSPFLQLHIKPGQVVHEEENVYLCNWNHCRAQNYFVKNDCIAVIVLSGDKDLILV